MNNNIFTIRNLQCKYPMAQFPVLEIESLDIAKGAVTFFIGASGIGKSTILETLGLMSNTLFPKPEHKCVFWYSPESEEIDLLDFWTWSEKKQSTTRKKNFSFIFQNNNLLPNLSAYENICLTGIIRGKTQGQAQVKADTIISTTFSADEVNKIHHGYGIFQFSGGQRQRVAFARALCSEYAVLFADEPTGNLDLGNAKKLMKTLVDNVEDKKTIIIVSHDISLALEHGNEIILIEKCSSGNSIHSYGYIHDQSKFKKTSENMWINGLMGKMETESLAHHIRSVVSL